MQVLLSHRAFVRVFRPIRPVCSSFLSSASSLTSLVRSNSSTTTATSSSIKPTLQSIQLILQQQHHHHVLRSTLYCSLTRMTAVVQYSRLSTTTTTKVNTTKQHLGSEHEDTETLRRIHEANKEGERLRREAEAKAEAIAAEALHLRLSSHRQDMTTSQILASTSELAASIAATNGTTDTNSTSGTSSSGTSGSGSGGVVEGSFQEEEQRRAKRFKKYLLVSAAATVLGLLPLLDYFTNQELKACGPYKSAMRILMRNQAVTSALGHPIQEGYRVKSKRNANKLHLEWTISSGEKTAKVIATSVFVNRHGTFTELYVILDSGERIDLVHPNDQVLTH